MFYDVALSDRAKTQIASAGRVWLSETEEDSLHRSKMIHAASMACGVVVGVIVMANASSNATGLFLLLLVEWCVVCPGLQPWTAAPPVPRP
eukprot:SAG22_NODE_958_length_6301_cov_4.995324_15_plen_91_part_00